MDIHSWVWRYTPVIPATWEAEADSEIKASLGETKNTKKGCEHG
jgi:hypothetical protein